MKSSNAPVNFKRLKFYSMIRFNQTNIYCHLHYAMLRLLVMLQLTLLDDLTLIKLNNRAIRKCVKFTSTNKYP